MMKRVGHGTAAVKNGQHGAAAALLGTMALACALAQPAAAQTAAPISRVQSGDATLDCAGIASEQKLMGDAVAAGDPTRTLGQAAAGGAANVGGQIAGGVVAQSSGLFGGLGGLVSKLAGGVAQQQVEQRMAPDPAAQQRAAQARERQSFLQALASAKACQPDQPTVAGRALSADEFAALTGQLAAGAAPKPLSAADVQALASQPLGDAQVPVALDGQLKLAGRRFYIAEFRVMFEVAGKVTANTRAGYMPGTNYGATRSTIRYAVAQPDIAAMQAITDRAWADFQQRLAAAGVTVQARESFIAENGEVYTTTEPASAVGAPVYVEENLGYTERKYLVMAPTGMKLHSRGFSGVGAGNMSKRMDFVRGKLEGLSVSVALNIAALESSGGGSSIFNRDGSSTGAGQGLALVPPVGGFVITGHSDAGALRLAKPVPVAGNFARFRESGGYDTQKDGAVRSLQLLGNMAGVAANTSNTREMEVDLDGPTTARLMLQALGGFNQALTERIKAAL